MKSLLKQLTKVHGIDKIRLIQDNLNMPSTIQKYTINNNDYHNLYLVVQGQDGHRPEYPNHYDLVTAHHDVVNRRHQNILDNTASILNLIRIANSLKPKYDIVIAFTDAEETCSLQLNGARIISNTFKIHQHLDLELTASGKNLVIDTYGKFRLIDGVIRHSMPYNNARASSRFDTPTIGSACLTLVDDNDLKQLRGFGYCDRWLQCHKSTDDMRWYDEADCDRLIDFVLETFRQGGV